MIGVAYAVGLMSDFVLSDDDVCVTASPPEAAGYEVIQKWFPPRSDCRFTGSDGTARGIESGSSEVFLAMFGLTVVVAVMLVSRIALVQRVIVVLAAAAAAFFVIFV